MTSPRIRITVDGKPASTTAQAAARHGVKPATLRAQLSRGEVPVEPAAYLDARTPLYLDRDVERVMSARPGRGAPGAPRRRSGQR